YVPPHFAQQTAVPMRGRSRSYARDHSIVAVGCDGETTLQNAIVEALTVANRADAAPDHIAQHGDTTVGGSEMFEDLPRNSTMNADLSVVIAGNSLPIFVRAATVLTETGAATQLPSTGDMVVTDLHGVRVVQRHRPGSSERSIDGVALRHRIGIGWKLVDVGKNKIGDTHPNPVTVSARIDIDHADRRLNPVPLAKLLEVSGKSLAARQGMQKRQMRRVHAVFFDLKPVAFPHGRSAGLEPITRQVIGIEQRERRPPLRRSHVAE